MSHELLNGLEDVYAQIGQGDAPCLPDDAKVHDQIEIMGSRSATTLSEHGKWLLMQMTEIAFTDESDKKYWLIGRLRRILHPPYSVNYRQVAEND